MFRNPFKKAAPAPDYSQEVQELRAKEQTFLEIIAALDEEYNQLSESGIYVTPSRAMQQATVWACVRIISEIIATLPIMVQVKESGRWVEAEQHDALDLLHEPNEWQTKHGLISYLITWAELRGNAYLFKNRTANGRIGRLLPLDADCVEIEELLDWRIRYHVSSFQSPGAYDSTRIFHLRNFGNEGFRGLSTIGNHRNGIGLAIQLEQHANAAYKNGLQTNKWITTEKTVREDQLNALKTQLANYQGASKANKVPIFAGGIELHESKGISAVDAQYIESRKMQKQEIASIFGVPLFLLNDTEKSTTWGTGLEQLSRSFVKFSLDPRLSRLAQTLQRELLDRQARRDTRFKFDTDEFTLGEFKERMEGYRSAIESGVLNPNEAREIEGRNPREGGDEYRIPMNTAIQGQETEQES